MPAIPLATARALHPSLGKDGLKTEKRGTEGD